MPWQFFADYLLSFTGLSLLRSMVLKAPRGGFAASCQTWELSNLDSLGTELVGRLMKRSTSSKIRLRWRQGTLKICSSVFIIYCVSMYYRYPLTLPGSGVKFQCGKGAGQTGMWKDDERRMENYGNVWSQYRGSHRYRKQICKAPPISFIDGNCFVFRQT